MNYLKRNWQLYTMIIPGVLLLLVFAYFPMYGIIMAFKRFKPTLGFFASPWADPWYRYFEMALTDAYFLRAFRNTLILGVETLLITFPAPIVLALLFNELFAGKFKRTIQTLSYMPHFLSTVIVVGLMKLLMGTNGPMAELFSLFGLTWSNPFNSAAAFRALYIGSSVWTGVGYNSIIYLAAISGIDQEMYEAATIDGASRFQKVRYITFPSILPTTTILFIFAVSGIISNDSGKILLMYNEGTYSTADVIGTFTYRKGIENSSNSSFASACGLFQTAIAFVLLAVTNFIAARMGETSLW